MKSDRQMASLGASITMGAMLTSGCGWLSVLLGWCAGGLLRGLLAKREPKTEDGRGTAIGILLGTAVVMAAVLLGADGAFPESGTFPFVSLGLLAILWRAMWGRREALPGVSNCLGLILLAILTGLLLFGLGEADWGEITPGTLNWKDSYLALLCTCPWWIGRRNENWGQFLLSGGLCVGMSVLASGVLGRGLAAAERFPLYRTVQAIKILGVLQRLEAFLAGAILMGAFGILLLLGRRAGQSMERLFPVWKRKWQAAVYLGVVFGLECCFRWMLEREMLWVKTVFWGFLPVYTLWVVFGSKNEKSQGKT